MVYCFKEPTGLAKLVPTTKTGRCHSRQLLERGLLQGYSPIVRVLPVASVALPLVVSGTAADKSAQFFTATQQFLQSGSGQRLFCVRVVFQLFN